MAGTYNFTIDQGSDFSLLITYKDDSGTPISLTGKTISAKARAKKENKNASFVFGYTPRDQTTNTGEFYLTLPNEASSAVPLLDLNKFFYDVELNDAGVITRLFQGTVTISREITR